MARWTSSQWKERSVNTSGVLLRTDSYTPTTVLACSTSPRQECRKATSSESGKARDLRQGAVKGVV